MDLLARFRRPRPAFKVDPDTTLAIYLTPNGEQYPIKAGFLNTGGIPFANGAFSAYSNIQLTSTPQGYAFASIVSVWARRCVEIRAKSVSRLDFYVRSRRTKNRLPNHPLSIALRRAPQNIIRRIEWSLMIWGETFLVPLENEFGHYSDLHWLNNIGMSVDTTLGVYHNFSYFPILGGTPQIYTPSQIAFFKTDNPFDDLRGLSPFESVLLDVGTDRDMARTQKAFYANDTRIGKMLVPENDLLPADAQAFMDYWRANFQGAQNAGKPVLMPSNIKASYDMTRPPVTEDVELSADVRRRICAAFGVPLSIAGAWDDANYQSAPAQRKSLYEETIIPECEDIAKEMTQKVMPFFDPSGNAEVDFDPTKIMATMEDQAGKTSAANSKLLSGGITLNEYRRIHENEPLPGGDVFYVPSSVAVTPVADIGKPRPAAPLPFQPSGVSQPPQPAPVGAPPQVPQPTAPKPQSVPVARGKAVSTDSVAEYAILAYFSAVGDLVRLQNTLYGMLPAGSIELNDPATFHTTVAICTGDLATIQDSLPLNPGAFSVLIDGMSIFASPDGYAIHLTIRPQGVLMEVQAALAQTLQAAGLSLSPFSLPDQYKPHVTLAYSPLPIKPFDIEPFSLTVNRIEVSDANKQPIIRETLKAKLVRTKQQTIEDELRAWEKKCKNQGAVKAAAFNVDFLNGDVALYIRSTLLTNPERDMVRQTFQEARNMLAIKDYEDTRAGYKGAVYDLILKAQQDEIVRRGWAANMRTVNRRWGLQTAQDALEDAGENVESFTPAQLDAFRAWEGETSGFITAFGSELFKEGGISEAEVAARSDMWTHMSLDGLYNRMRALAQPAQRAVYRLGATEKHCPDCSFLNGKVATREAWRKSGWEPHSGIPDRHACKQFNCDCDLEDTQDPISFDPFAYNSQGKS